MLAMVALSCGHSGRALVADKLVWSLFCLLQVATVLRIGAAAQSALRRVAAVACRSFMGGHHGVVGHTTGKLVRPRPCGRTARIKP